MAHLIIQNLTDEQITAKAPAYSGTQPHQRTTTRYKLLETKGLVAKLRTLDWKVVSAQQDKCKSENKPYQKHMIGLVNDTNIVQFGTAENFYWQIFLINAHTGKNAFNFQVGIYNTSNHTQLILGNQNFQNLHVRHVSFKQEDIQEQVVNILQVLNTTYRETILRFAGKFLTRNQQIQFAQDAFNFRKSAGENRALDYVTLLVGLNDNESLWKVYQQVHNKLLTSNYRLVEVDNKGITITKKANSIIGLKRNIAFNNDMYKLAVSFLDDEQGPPPPPPADEVVVAVPAPVVVENNVDIPLAEEENVAAPVPLPVF